MKLCPMCGNQNEDTSNFCTTCGAKLSVPEPEQTPLLEEPVLEEPVAVPEPESTPVLEEIDPWQAFAPPAPVETERSVVPEEEGAVAVADPPAASPVCPGCGRTWSEGAKFCVYCGAGAPVPEIEPEPEPEVKAEPVREVVCPTCGTTLAAGAKFCINCGTSLIPAPAPEPEPEPVCPTCGTVLSVGAKFCINCGTSLILAPETPPAQGPVCPDCGAPLAEGAKFCTACGANLIPAPAEDIAQTEKPKKEKKPKKAKKAPAKKKGGLARAVMLWLALLCFIGMLAVCFLWNGIEIFTMRAWDNYDEAALLHEAFQRPELAAAREKLSDGEWERFSARMDRYTQEQMRQLYDECGLTYFSTYAQAQATLDELGGMSLSQWQEQYLQWQEEVQQWEEQNQQYTATLQSQLGQMCQSFRTAGGADYDHFWDYLNLWRYSLREVHLRFDGFSSEFIQMYNSYLAALKARGGEVDAAGSLLLQDYDDYNSALYQADPEKWGDFWSLSSLPLSQRLPEQRYHIEDYFPDVPDDNIDMFLAVVNTITAMPVTSERQSGTTPGLMIEQDGTVSRASQYNANYNELRRWCQRGSWYSWWNLFSERLPMTMVYADSVDVNAQLISLYDFLLCCGMTERELEDLLELITLYTNATDDEIQTLTQVLGADLDGEGQPPAFPMETPFPEDSQEKIITAILQLETGEAEDVLLPLYQVGTQDLTRLYEYRGLESRLQTLKEGAPYAAGAYEGLADGTLSADMLQVRQYGSYLFWPVAALLLLLVLIFTLARGGKVVGALAAILGGGVGLAYAWMGPVLSQEMTLRMAAAALAGALILLGLLALILRPRKIAE